MRQAVQTPVVTTFEVTLLSVPAFSHLLGIEDAISPLRMGIMINAELSFHVFITRPLSWIRLCRGDNIQLMPWNGV